MIIQTGMRTDIPAFYAEWFCNRLRAGSVCVRNPYHFQQVSRYRLSPEVVDLIGFCTKNPAPMLSHMDLLKPYGMYWFVTIPHYGKEIETGVPPKEQVLAERMLSPGAMIPFLFMICIQRNTICEALSGWRGS